MKTSFQKMFRMFNGRRLMRCLEVKIKMYGLRVMLHGHNPMYLFPFHTKLAEEFPSMPVHVLRTSQLRTLPLKYYIHLLRKTLQLLRAYSCHSIQATGNLQRTISLFIFKKSCIALQHSLRLIKNFKSCWTKKQCTHQSQGVNPAHYQYIRQRLLGA